jgi:DNA-binding transcriptional LysR family regulator
MMPRSAGKYLFHISLVRCQLDSLRLRSGLGAPRSLARRSVVSRVWMLVMAVVAGAAVALGATFTVTSVLSSSNESPVNQQLYNYGTR